MCVAGAFNCFPSACILFACKHLLWYIYGVRHLVAAVSRFDIGNDSNTHSIWRSSRSYSKNSEWKPHAYFSGSWEWSWVWRYLILTGGFFSFHNMIFSELKIVVILDFHFQLESTVSTQHRWPEVICRQSITKSLTISEWWEIVRGANSMFNNSCDTRENGERAKFATCSHLNATIVLAGIINLSAIRSRIRYGCGFSHVRSFIRTKTYEWKIRPNMIFFAAGVSCAICLRPQRAKGCGQQIALRIAVRCKSVYCRKRCSSAVRNKSHPKLCARSRHFSGTSWRFLRVLVWVSELEWLPSLGHGQSICTIYIVRRAAVVCGRHLPISLAFVGRCVSVFFLQLGSLSIRAHWSTTVASRVSIFFHRHTITYIR